MWLALLDDPTKPALKISEKYPIEISEEYCCLDEAIKYGSSLASLFTQLGKNRLKTVKSLALVIMTDDTVWCHMPE